MIKIGWLALFLSCSIFAQNRQLLYGFSEVPQSLLLNPGGKVNNDWYFGIPLISYINATVGASGVSLYDLFAEDGNSFNTKLKNIVYRLKPNDFFTFNQQLEIFSGGFAFGPSFNKNEYLSFGLYQEVDAIVYFPKDYAILAYEGNQDNINRPFNLGHLEASAEVISIIHLGYNKKVNKNFSYGFRGKIYSNILNFSSINNRGTFVTVPGKTNFYDHIFNLDLELKTSGLASLTGDSDFKAKDLTKRILFGGNLGLGFDAGFTYHINKQLYLDASLLDLGFIRHSKDVENYKLEGDYLFEGINPIFPESGSTQTADEYWSEIESEFEDLFDLDTTSVEYTTWRPVKLNASLNYAFGKKVDKECNCSNDKSGYLNRIGLQLYGIKRPKQPQLVLTGYYYRKLFKGFVAKASYSIDSYSFSNLGFGLSVQLRGINFYIMADNLLEYQNIYDAQNVSLQLGFNYIFKKNED